MRHCNQGSIQRRVSFLRRQFLQDGNLPFTDVLSRKSSRKHSPQLVHAGTTESSRHS